MKTWIYENIRTLPWMMQIGLGILAIFGAFDLLYHSLPAGIERSLDLVVGQDAIVLHIGILIGMVVSLLGLVLKEVIYKSSRTFQQFRKDRVVR